MALDPSAPGRWAAVGFAAVCAVLLARVTATRRRRRTELVGASGVVAVPTWVDRSARVMGPVPWPLPQSAGAVAALVAAVVCGGLLIGSLSAYEDRLARAVESTATVVDVDPEDAFYITLEGADGRRWEEILTLDQYPVGQQVEIRTDPEEPGWVELVAEPTDTSWWLSLSLGAFILAVVLGQEALARRRGLTRLLSGSHPGVEVCAAPVPEEEHLIGLAHLDDPARRVFAVVDGALAVPRDMPEDGAEEPEPEEETRWARPTRVTLLGDLREGGQVAVLLDSLIILGPALRVRPRDVVDLPDPGAGRPLPTDLERGATSEEEIVLLRAEAFGDAEHVTGAATLPALPMVVAGAPWFRALGALEAAAGLTLAPLGVWFLADLAWWEMALAATFGGWLLLNGATNLRPPLRLTETGLAHPYGLRTWVMPWAGVKQAMVRDDVVLLEIDPASAPRGEVDLGGDLTTYESGHLASAQVARETAEVVELLRRTQTARVEVTAVGAERPGAEGSPPWGQAGPLAAGIVGVMALHVLVSLLALNIVLGR